MLRAANLKAISSLELAPHGCTAGHFSLPGRRKQNQHRQLVMEMPQQLRCSSAMA
jgi:hypothetical protein